MRVCFLSLPAVGAVRSMLLVPPSRVYRPPPDGVGQFQIPFSMGVGGLILAAMLLTQNPSAALAVLPRSNPAAACPDRPAPPLLPAPPTLEAEAARGLGVVLGAGVVPLGVLRCWRTQKRTRS